MSETPPMSSGPELPPPYTGYIGVPGEGVRFGAMSCTRCGAAVLIVPGEDNGGLHDEWHHHLSSLNEVDPFSPEQHQEGEGK